MLSGAQFEQGWCLVPTKPGLNDVASSPRGMGRLGLGFLVRFRVEGFGLQKDTPP